MNRTVYPDPVCVQDALSRVGIYEPPVRKPCGAHGYESDPCDLWNRQPMCATDRLYYEPVCVGSETPPQPPCFNNLTLTFRDIEEGEAMSFLQFGITYEIEGESFICIDRPMNGSGISGAATGAEVAQAFADAFVGGGFGTVDGNTWQLDGAILDDCCSGENRQVVLVALGLPPELFTDTFTCCPPTEAPCTKTLGIRFPAIAEGVAGGWTGVTLQEVGGGVGCYSETWEPDLLVGPLTSNQLATRFETHVGPGVGTVVGDTFVLDAALAESCCDLGVLLEAVFTWTESPVFAASVFGDCCGTGGGGSGGNPTNNCPEGDIPGTVRWKFTFTEPPGVVWGQRPICDCGLYDNGTTLPGPEPNTYPDFTAKLVLPTDDVFYYNRDREITSIQAGCYPDFASFAAGILDVILNNAACPGFGACFRFAGQTGTLTFPSPDVAEFEIFYDLETIRACFPTVCEQPLAWKFARSDRDIDGNPIPGTPAVVTPIYEPIVDWRCCEFVPDPPPPPPDPPGFCEHDCPEPVRRICSNPPDLLRFHFQMPDELNTWPDGATAGWTQTGAPWLATVYAHSEDCCTPPWELLAHEYMVGTFNNGKQRVQNIVLDPTFLPRRFYLQFVFNTATEGETISLYTQYYERMCCPEETAYIEWEYPNLDCEGQYYGEPEAWLGTSALAFRPAMRVRGALQKLGYSIEREEEDNRTRRILSRAQYRLTTEWLPEYMIDRLRLALAAPTLRINGERMEFSGTLQRDPLKGAGGHITVDLIGPECETGSPC